VIRPDLVADCGACAALCCELLAFDAGPQFAFGKPAGVRCPHLLPTNLCAEHGRLEQCGFAGCAAYDCHGAGPRATRLFAASSLTDGQRHAVFAILRDLHELMWLVSGAAARCSSETLRAELDAKVSHLASVAGSSAAVLLELDLRALRTECRDLVGRLRDLWRKSC
jgi:hypothetical protein